MSYDTIDFSSAITIPPNFTAACIELSAPISIHRSDPPTIFSRYIFRIFYASSAFLDYVSPVPPQADADESCYAVYSVCNAFGYEI